MVSEEGLNEWYTHCQNYITVGEYAMLIRAPSVSAGYANPSLALRALIGAAHSRTVVQASWNSGMTSSYTILCGLRGLCGMNNPCNGPHSGPYRATLGGINSNRSVDDPA